MEKTAGNQDHIREHGEKREQTLVYVASPLRAKTEKETLVNMQLAKRYTGHVNDALNELGAADAKAVAPHAFLPRILDDGFPAQRKLALEFGRQLLQICSLLVVFTENGKTTEGMRLEIRQARTLGIPVIDIHSIHRKAGGTNITDTLRKAISENLMVRENPKQKKR